MCALLPQRYVKRNPFKSDAQKKLFCFRNLNIAFRIHDINIFNGTASNVIGLKLAGLSVEPFLWISVVAAK